MPTSTLEYAVRAAHCDHLADDDTVYETLKTTTAPLERAWARLQQAKRIVIKFNQDNIKEELVHLAGQRQQLVSDSVVRATLRLLREKTDAQLFCADVSYYVMYNKQKIENTLNIGHILREFDVTYLDGTKPQYQLAQTPGGGLIGLSATVLV